MAFDALYPLVLEIRRAELDRYPRGLLARQSFGSEFRARRY
jgi:hypothetical protein